MTGPAIKEDTSFKGTLDLLRKANTAADFREALHVADLRLGLAGNPEKVQLGKGNRDLLVDQLHLTPEELKAVESASFRPLDAYHLKQCFLLRDAARKLEQPGLDSLTQARLGLEWVARQVRLWEQNDSLIPPLFVLPAGQGTSRERALVFLALLHQFQIPGCILAWPGKETGSFRALLVGVIAGQDRQSIFLYDPRQGWPVPGPGGKGIATLAQLRQEPGLFPVPLTPTPLPGGGERGRGEGPEIQLVCPLTALSRRMKLLENELAVQDRVSLAIDPVALRNQVKQVAGQEVSFWSHAPFLKAVKPVPCPTRMLGRFLPPSKGGSDTMGRLEMFKSNLNYLPLVTRQLTDMQLLDDRVVPKEAREMLLHFTRLMFAKYVLEPRDFLLRGDYEMAIKRLNAIRQALEDEELAAPGDQEFRNQLAQWRKQVHDAYLAKYQEQSRGQKQSKGKELVEKLWREDQYLLVLLHAQEFPDFHKHEKKILSSILLKAVREVMMERTNYLLAQAWREKAERYQAGWQRLQGEGRSTGSNAVRVRKNTLETWKDTFAWWEKYQQRHGFEFASLPEQLAKIRQPWQRRDYQAGISLWDFLFKEIGRSLEARMSLAETLIHLGKQAEAQAQLNRLHQDLSDLLANKTLARDLADNLEKTRTMNNYLMITLLERITYNLGPEGSFLALRDRGRELSKKSRRQ